MGYQALYRTWRPERFSDFVAQDSIITTLKNQIASGRIPHAYLFCGSRGTGKTSTAKVLARTVNCENPQHGDLCGICPTCVHLAGENNMDIIEIDAASNNGVDNVRELNEKIQYPPSTCKYKVYIIDEVHMMSSSAFNALLKTLEEPPAHAIFIFATTEPQKLPSTILSRCQRFDFKRIPAHDIAEYLRNILDTMKITADDNALYEIAAFSEGGMRDALSTLDICISYADGERISSEIVHSVIGSVSRATVFEFVDALSSLDGASALTIINRVMKDGQDPTVFANDIISHLRALLLATICDGGLTSFLDISQEDETRMIEQARSTSANRIMRQMDLFIHAENEMKWASAPHVVLELCAVRACHPERETTEDALVDRLTVLETKITSGAIQVSDDTRKASRKTSEPPHASSPTVKTTQAVHTEKATVVQEDETKLYQQTLKLIGKQDANIVMVLKKASFAGVTNGAAHIEFPEGNEVFIALITQESKKAILESCFSEVFGRPLRVVITQKDAKTKSTAEKDIIDRVIDTFSRENVIITDNEV